MTEADTESNKHDDVQLINVFFTPSEVSEKTLKDYNVVIVVDVLRAATSIATALAKGAQYVIPVPSIDEATSLAAQLARDSVLLCGEREGKIIEGFHIGNSPADYTRERVRARHLIFGSTNGSPAVVKASVAKSVYMAGFVNLNAVIEEVSRLENHSSIALVCAGKLSKFAIEDAVCAGRFIERIKENAANPLQLNDAARSSVVLANKFGKNLLKMLKESDHGKFLIEIGMEGDLELCAADSELEVAPILQDGKLVKHRIESEVDQDLNGS